ncbi:MAG: WXG100 family type VII secretion target [Lachnospiraceae bacterium]|nr:WXG100 family type VII secretion target [Lachnospiraceae bacterium]
MAQFEFGLMDTIMQGMIRDGGTVNPTSPVIPGGGINWPGISGGFMQNLLVTPEVLLAKADTVLGKIRSMQTSFQELEAKVTGTANYWQGEASDAHREKYNAKKEEIELIFTQLIGDTENLRTIAAQYTTTENANVEISADLPGDVIV